MNKKKDPHGKDMRSPHGTRNWRNIDWSEENLQKLKEEVETFVPLHGQTKLNRMNILLLGQVGAGKSSVINTFSSIFGDYASHKAESTSSDTSVTRVYRQYQMRSRTGKELAFRLCDTKGIEDGETIRTVEIERMIDGEKSDMETSQPSYETSARATYWKDKLYGLIRWISGWIWKEKEKDNNKRAYCVVYVMDGSSIDIIPESVENYIKDCRKIMKEKNGIPEIVLLTKVDNLSVEVKKDLKAISSITDIDKTIKKVMGKFKFEENQIFPVTNMLKELKASKEMSILFLIALRQILHEGRGHIQDLVDTKRINIDVSNDSYV